MDLRSLNTFIQVAEVKSFTRAAAILGYSQPTISFQIKQLETELGVQLFERIGRTVNLTDDGYEVLSYAQHICRLTEEMKGEAQKRYEPNGRVHIAMADSLCTPLIARTFDDFRKTYPKISLQVTTAGTGELFRLLDQNEVDMVCTLDNHVYNTDYIIVQEEKVDVHFVVSAQDPLAQKKQVTIGELLSYPFLLTEKGMSYRRLLDENLAKYSIEIHPVLEMGGADILCKLVTEGAGVSFLPDYVTEEAVKKRSMVRLQVEDFQIEIWKQLFYHRDKWVTAQMKAMLDHLSKVWRGKP